MILSMDPDNSLILCLRLSAIIYNNAFLVFSTEFVRQADIHILFLIYTCLSFIYLNGSYALFPLSAELSPSTFNIMLLSEDVKLKFYYTFIKKHMQNQNLNRRLLLLLSRDLTGKSKKRKNEEWCSF